ncbi:MAG: ferrous iron transporter B [Actinobacteria bacterium]|nr:ferrous iron transporter B [Actinomycetota bacterium]
MPISCHSALNKIKGEVDFSFALAGNPNVGKSSIFNSLTGMGVVTANYPGKTVEINIASTVFGSYHIGIIDLPGTYAIGAISEDQWVARQGILDGKPDLILVIVDATNLSRNLYMVLQFLDLKLPLVIALNLMDQAKKQGIHINIENLSKLLGVPVIPTVATQGIGLDELMRTAIEVAENKSSCTLPSLMYGKDIEEPISNLSSFIENKAQKLPYNLSARAIAILLLEQDSEFTKLVGKLPQGKEILEETNKLIEIIEKKHNETSSLRITRERHGLAGEIAAEIQRVEFEDLPFSEKIWHYTTSPITSGVLMQGLTPLCRLEFLMF